MGARNSKAAQTQPVRTQSVEDVVLEPRPQQKTIDYKDTIEFVPPFNEGQVVKVNGAIITIAARLPYYDDSPAYRVHVKLLGAKMPDSAEKELSDLVMGKKVKLRNTHYEGGFLIADVYCGHIHLNEWLEDQYVDL